MDYSLLLLIFVIIGTTAIALMWFAGEHDVQEIDMEGDDE